MTLVLDFPKNEHAYNHPSEAVCPQDPLGVEMAYEGISLLEVEQPWLALDEFLGFNPASTIENDVDPYQFLTDIGRRGLGYVSPQKSSQVPTSSGELQDDKPMVSQIETALGAVQPYTVDRVQGSSGQDTSDRIRGRQPQTRPSLRSFVSNIPSHIEDNLLAIPSSSPSSKATTSSISVALLKTPSTDYASHRAVPTLAPNPPRRTPNIYNRDVLWDDVSVSRSLTEPCARSTEATVSESLYQMLFNNTKSTDRKLPPSLTPSRQQPVEVATEKVKNNSTFQPSQKTIQGPDLFANDDDDY